MSYPGKDFVPVAEDYEHWLTHGTGQDRRPKDVVQGFRNQLRMRPDVQEKTAPGAPGLRVVSDARTANVKRLLAQADRLEAEGR